MHGERLRGLDDWVLTCERTERIETIVFWDLRLLLWWMN